MPEPSKQPSSNITLYCWGCKKEVKVAVKSLKWIRCPHCGRPIDIGLSMRQGRFKQGGED